jgi:hypothetical protein
MIQVRPMVALLMVSASLVLAAGADAATARTCGFIRASVPYSAHGQADRWHVYVDGSASCATAVKVLDAVMHLQGKQHQGASEANSYFTFAGWLCPSGAMGFQSCELPRRLPMQPPIRAHALARDCAMPPSGCPAHVPSSDL